jgi:hypothetical protein
MTAFLEARTPSSSSCGSRKTTRIDTELVPSRNSRERISGTRAGWQGPCDPGSRL